MTSIFENGRVLNFFENGRLTQYLRHCTRVSHRELETKEGEGEFAVNC